MAAAIVLSAFASPAPAGIIVDHQPHRFAGFTSDTEFLTMFGQPFSNRVADDFVLSEPATISHVAFWGFYDLNILPLSERYRVRFYGARPADGLPDESNILFEESFLNPARTETDEFIILDYSRVEYFYEVDLTRPVSLQGNVPYWLEIVQLGNVRTAFWWVSSRADANGVASINPSVTDWRQSTASSDTAYQLYGVPEPATLELVLVGFCVFRFRPRRKEA